MLNSQRPGSCGWSFGGDETAFIREYGSLRSADEIEFGEYV
jgi:hypothetical protein